MNTTIKLFNRINIILLCLLVSPVNGDTISVNLVPKIINLDIEDIEDIGFDISIFDDGSNYAAYSIKSLNETEFDGTCKIHIKIGLLEISSNELVSVTNFSSSFSQMKINPIEFDHLQKDQFSSRLSITFGGTCQGESDNHYLIKLN